VYADPHCYAMQNREAWERELAGRMGERRRQGPNASCKPSLRALMARRPFALAGSPRKETWNEVWERLEAKGRL